jgi:hypothetical protein
MRHCSRCHSIWSTCCTTTLNVLSAACQLVTTYSLKTTRCRPVLCLIRASLLSAGVRSYLLQTSDAERIGVDQVAKILPSGKATGSEQRK